MKLFLQNTSRGLIPLYDEDYDEKKKLKLNEVYLCDIKKPRNPMFHRKYFSLVNLAWEYLNENAQKSFNDSVEIFRKSLEVTAGHCERIWNARLKSWVDIPKSIAFDKMDDLEFQDLYDRVLNVVLQMVAKNVTREEFEAHLMTYL